MTSVGGGIGGASGFETSPVSLSASFMVEGALPMLVKLARRYMTMNPKMTVDRRIREVFTRQWRLVIRSHIVSGFDTIRWRFSRTPLPPARKESIDLWTASMTVIEGERLVARVGIPMKERRKCFKVGIYERLVCRP